MWDWLRGKKTYIGGCAAIIIVILQHAGISIPGVSVDDTLVMQAILAMTIRHGISTGA